MDRTLVVPGFAAGGVWRAASFRAACGGKGVNVARALVRLDRPALCLGPLGGVTGEAAAAAAEAEGLAARWTSIAGETRTCVIIVGDLGETTVINEPGPVISATEWAELCAALSDAAVTAQAVCISGSLPQGCPPGGFRQLLAGAAAASGAPAWVDSSGAALAEAVAAGAWIKVNAVEAGALLGERPVDAGDAPGAAREIQRRGAARVVITLGAEGAVLAMAGFVWRVSAPAVEPVNPVGSGDCFLAGLVSGLTAGARIETALATAAACGAANARHPAIASFAPGEVAALSASVEISRISG